MEKPYSLEEKTQIVVPEDSGIYKKGDILLTERVRTADQPGDYVITDPDSGLKIVSDEDPLLTKWDDLYPYKFFVEKFIRDPETEKKGRG